ncbi:MAG: tRNA (adenosine(37)-N6)-threonylcarbamoyltransferase complex dimerization subunit type 1 TsaB [Phenylobacterium zucineum]|nr:MAG: tRNA (adenosine(37)-N6)-threonylcarbamoyltransferase complex dimerization subunit type 1 TsaB [Phenylobacterium zucineum]
MTLALDTCLSACSAALVRDGEVLSRLVEPMSRGHQERLADLVAETLAEAGLSFGDLTRIAVTVGPGSFTGLRVGLAFAKGLGAALDLPVIGVGTLEAMGASLATASGLLVAVLEAKRGQVYFQAFEQGQMLTAPAGLDINAAGALLVDLSRTGTVTLIGSGTDHLCALVPRAEIVRSEFIDPVHVARLAAMRSPTPPRPLYLRAPDAKRPGGLTP